MEYGYDDIKISVVLLSLIKSCKGVVKSKHGLRI